MTRDQVYAAKNMYEKHLKEIAKYLKIDIYSEWNVDNILLAIVKKTKKQNILYDAIRYYKYYVDMNCRIYNQIWNEKEDI